VEFCSRQANVTLGAKVRCISDPLKKPSPRARRTLSALYSALNRVRDSSCHQLDSPQASQKGPKQGPTDIHYQIDLS